MTHKIRLMEKYANIASSFVHNYTEKIDRMNNMLRNICYKIHIEKDKQVFKYITPYISKNVTKNKNGGKKNGKRKNTFN